MIYEYAIEPELAVSWGKDRAEFRYYYNQFGLGTPRMMADFPKFKNWRKQFRQAAANADETNEMARIEEIFKILKEKRIHRNGFDYDGNIPWLKNAELEHARKEFHAILAKTNPTNHSKVLTPSSLDLSNLWQVKKQFYCPRQAHDMAQIVKEMLSNCSEVHFIDPYFDPSVKRWRRSFKDFLKSLFDGRTYRPEIERIIVHTSDKTGFTYKYLKDASKKKLPSVIPLDISLAVKMWKQQDGGERLHNRYILTDIGGVKFDPGLDDGEEGESVEVILLERDLYEKQWNDYVKRPAFILEESPIEIKGIGNIKNAKEISKTNSSN